MMTEGKDYEVKASAKHGQGIFALRPIEFGETIFEWHPKVLTVGEANELPPEELKHYTYPDGENILWMQPPERYINHACEPNTKVVGQSDVASRDIEVGEEITSDYLDVETEDFICNCGSDYCRKSSRSED
jgi:SET domain-containing protein